MAKGDGAVAHEGRIEHVAVKDAEALRSLFAQTADEIANVIVTARVPLRAHTSDEPDSVR